MTAIEAIDTALKVKKGKKVSEKKLRAALVAFFNEYSRLVDAGMPSRRPL